MEYVGCRCAASGMPSASYAVQKAIVAMKEKISKHWCGTCAQNDLDAITVLECLKDKLIDIELEEENEDDYY